MARVETMLFHHVVFLTLIPCNSISFLKLFWESKRLLHPAFQEILTEAVWTRKEERRNSIGVVNPVTFLHLEPLQIQKDCTIAAEKDIIKFVLVLISHVL